MNNYKKALSLFIEVPMNKIKEIDDNTFTVKIDGEEQEYLVATEDEARELTAESLEELAEECGVTSIFKGWDRWQYAVDEDKLSEYVYNDFLGYYEDIKFEPSERFESRLIEEAYDLGILDDDDFDEENGYLLISDNIDDLAEKCAEHQSDMYLEEKIKWLEDSFGSDTASDILSDMVDFEELANMVNEEFGWGHELDLYDNSTNSEEVNGVEYFIFRRD
jgi:hypothetical protein